MSRVIDQASLSSSEHSTSGAIIFTAVELSEVETRDGAATDCSPIRRDFRLGLGCFVQVLTLPHTELLKDGEEGRAEADGGVLCAEAAARYPEAAIALHRVVELRGRLANRGVRIDVERIFRHVEADVVVVVAERDIRR